MLLQRQLKDPRLGFVTVTEVDTSPTSSKPRSSSRCWGLGRAQWATSFKALESARGFVWGAGCAATWTCG